MGLVVVLVSEFAQCFSFQMGGLDGRIFEVFIEVVTFHGFAFHSFPADGTGQKSPLETHCVHAFGNVAWFISVSTPS